jgi:hypothetical protein
VKASRNVDPVQRPLSSESILNQPQHRHLACRPIDPITTCFGKAEVSDVVIVCGCHFYDSNGSRASDVSPVGRTDRRPDGMNVL